MMLPISMINLILIRILVVVLVGRREGRGFIMA